VTDAHFIFSALKGVVVGAVFGAWWSYILHGTVVGLRLVYVLVLERSNAGLYLPLHPLFCLVGVLLLQLVKVPAWCMPLNGAQSPLSACIMPSKVQGYRSAVWMRMVYHRQQWRACVFQADMEIFFLPIRAA